MMRRATGFTLLEVMISIGILAVSLLALFELQSTSLLSSGRAQKISTSTLLAQRKMAETLVKIDEGIAKGEFPDEKEETGTFEEESLPDYAWKVKIRKVEVPAPPSIEGESEIMTQAFSQIAKDLSQATREVTVTIYWKEFDEDVEGIKVVTHVVKML